MFSRSLTGETLMWRSIIRLLPLALVPWAAPAPAHAAGQGYQPRFGLGAGLNAPTGEYRADAQGYGFDIGWMLTGHIDVRSGPVGLRLSASLGENGANDKLNEFATTTAGREADFKTRLLSVMLNGTYALRGSDAGLTAYLISGVGFCKVTLDLALSGGGSADTSEINLAWNLGAGVSRRIGSTVYFLEARHVWVREVFGPGDISYLPVALGVKLRL